MKHESREAVRTPRWIVPSALILASLLLRLYASREVSVVEPDGAFYGRLAQEILTRSGDRGFHEAWPPMYPRLIAGAAFLLHPGMPPRLDGLADPARVERAARFVSSLLGALLVWPVYLMSRRALGRKGAMWAGLVVVCHPRLMVFSTHALTEMTFTFATVSALAFAGAAFGSPRGGLRAIAGAVFAGLTGGTAFLTRPEGFVLLPLGFLAALLGRWDKAARRWAGALAFAAAFLALAGPHILRVSDVSGRLSLGAKSDYNLALAYAGAPGAPAFDPSKSRYNNLITKNGGQGFNPDPIPRFSLPGLVLSRPDLVFEHFATEFPSALVAVFSLAYVPFALLAVVGVAGRRSKWTGEEKLWLSTWITFVAVYSLAFAYRRFFAAMLPLLLIESSAGLLLVRARWPRFGLAALGLLLALGPALALRTLRGEAHPAEQCAAGRFLLERHPPGSGITALERRPRLMARKPFAAYYGGLGILAMARVGPDSVAAEARSRGASYLLIDERDLVRERPELGILLDPGRAPPELLGVWSSGSAPNRAVLYEVQNASRPGGLPFPEAAGPDPTQARDRPRNRSAS